MAVLDILRIVVFGFFAYTGVVAVSSWAVRTRRINPFSRTGQAIQKVTDPMLKPVETWLWRRGSNPVNAGWWLVGIAIVGGIVVITAAEFLFRTAGQLAGAAASGPRGVLRVIVYYAGQLILIALIIRVVGSWFGVGRYNKWIGWTYKLTDWLVEPLRKIIPPLGMIDITPLVAWLLLQLVILPLILSVV